MDQITAMLKAKNLKVTPQRLAIFNILCNTVEHPSAESIYNALQETHPTMSLATIYKTLDTLKKANLIQELNVGEDRFRYDAIIHNHPHMICNTCGQVYDLHTRAVDQLIGQLQTETDFTIESEKIFLYGTCSDCKVAH